MPSLITYEKVKKHTNDYGIVLLTTREEFKNKYGANKKIKIDNQNLKCNCLYSCGHEKETGWRTIKRRIRDGFNTLCPDCASVAGRKVSREKKRVRDERIYQERNNFETNERKCSKCNLWLHIDNYGVDEKNKRDGIAFMCKKCHRERSNKARRNRTPDKFVKQILTKSVYNHREREKRGRNFEREHNYSIEDINNHKNENGKFIDVFTGEEIFPKMMEDKSKQMSLDRKDSEKTYWKDKSGETDEDNVQITSSTINNMKSDLSDEEFLSIIEKIAIYRLGMVHPK